MTTNSANKFLETNSSLFYELILQVSIQNPLWYGRNNDHWTIFCNKTSMKPAKVLKTVLLSKVVINSSTTELMIRYWPATHLNVVEAWCDPVPDGCLHPPSLGQFLSRADLTGVTCLRIRCGPGTGHRHVVYVYLDYRSIILTEIFVKAYWFIS